MCYIEVAFKADLTVNHNLCELLFNIKYYKFNNGHVLFFLYQISQFDKPANSTQLKLIVKLHVPRINSTTLHMHLSVPL